MIAGKKSKPESPQPKRKRWATPIWVEIDFVEARRLLHRFDRRRVTDRQRFLKAEALRRGWWVPRGVNDAWRMTPAWEQYYERKLREPEPPHSVTDVDRRLIAEARIRGIEPIPLAHQLTDELREYLLIELLVRVCGAAIRDLESRIFTPPPPPKQRGRPRRGGIRDHHETHPRQ
jgi:hypothetical protein